MKSTLLRSTSSCALVLAPAGLPPVSAEIISALRSPSLLPRSLRKRVRPCSNWMPPCASGPVLTVSRPILIGGACAIAGAPIRLAAAAAPVTNSRRLSLHAIEASRAGGSEPPLLLALGAMMGWPASARPGENLRPAGSEARARLTRTRGRRSSAAAFRDDALAATERDPPLGILAAVGLEDRARELGVERAAEHLLDPVLAGAPKLDRVGQLLPGRRRLSAQLHLGLAW